MFVEISIFVFTLALVYVICNRRRSLSLRSKMGLSGPPTNLVFGNSHQIGMFMKKHGPKMAKCLQQWTETYGKVFGFYMGPKYWIMVSDLDMAQEILVKQFDCFTDRMDMMLRVALGKSILSDKGHHWKETRSALSPQFSTHRMKQMSSIINQKLDIFVNNLALKASNGDDFDIYRCAKALTLDVVGKCAFAIDSSCQTDPNDPFLLNGIKFFEELPSPEKSMLYKVAAIFPELEWLCSALSNLTAMAAAENYLCNCLRKVIEHRLENKKFDSTDVIQLLLDRKRKVEEIIGNKEGFGVDRVSSNCFAFLLAGYETTSTTMGFATWLLAKHPQVQTKLQHEIDEHVANEKDINYELVPKLAYLDAVFRETLRLFPPIVMFTARKCVKECFVGDLRIEPGTHVLIPNYTIQHSEENWPQPELFKPERFLGPTKHHPMAWLPFGAGPRNCVGMRLAEMEIKLTLTRLLYRFNLEQGAQFQDPLPTTNHHVLFAPDQVLVKVTSRTKMRD